MWKIPLFDLNYGQEEQDAVIEVLNSKWLTAGSKTKAFESEFGKYLGDDVHCCAVSNGTAALHIALLCAGVKPGDEVIIPGLTFVADLNTVVVTGATPVLADIKSFEDWNIDPRSVAKKITPATKAVIAVHYAGWPCDMEELALLCMKNGLCLIEDAAHGPGASYKNKKCGAIGDIGCFSFFSNKNLSTGEGGMITSKNKENISKAMLLRSHGMTSMTIDRHEGRTLSYDVVMPGFNYRIDEIKSALGLVQLKKLDRANEKRRSIVSHYIKNLATVEKIHIPWQNFPDDRIGSGHIFPILVSERTDRNQFIAHLKEKGIQTSIHYPAFNAFSFYKQRFNQPLEISDRISARMVTLPLYPDLSMDDCELVCRSIKSFFI